MKQRLQHAALAAGLALMLGACGGGGGGADPVDTRGPTTERVPASATASATAWAAYAAMLTDSETRKPVEVNDVTPPTTETGTPNAL